jgi:hypothetical protein
MPAADPINERSERPVLVAGGLGNIANLNKKWRVGTGWWDERGENNREGITVASIPRAHLAAQLAALANREAVLAKSGRQAAPATAWAMAGTARLRSTPVALCMVFQTV